MQKKLIIYGISFFIIQTSYAMEPESDACGNSMPICGFSQERFSLHNAVRRADARAIKFLINKLHVNTAEINPAGDSPLHLAVNLGQSSIVQSLLELNSSANIQDASGRSPLHLAILNEMHEIILLLIPKTINLNTQDTKGNTVLLSALAAGNIPQNIVYSLLAHSPDVNIVNANGESPLHIAVKKGLFFMVRKLMELQANPNAQDVNGDAALHLALKTDKFDEKIFLELFQGSDEHKLNVNIANNDGDTALHIAVRKTLNFPAHKLLDAGADTRLKDAAGNTALHLVLDNDQFNRYYDGVLIERLEQRSSCIAGRNGLTPLHVAIKNRIVSAVKLFIRKQASTINAQDAAGNTPLHWALVGEDFSIEVVQLLLAHIASLPAEEKLAALSAQNADGNTPLHLALARENVSIDLMNLLLDHIASLPTREKYKTIKAKNAAGNRPLHLALAREDVSIEWVQLLLNHIASLPTEEKLKTINAKDVNGNTALHLAALIAGHNKGLAHEIINVLLHNGAGTRISNRNGQEACDLVPEDCPEIKYLINTFWRNCAIQFWATLKAIKNGTIYCTKILTNPITRLFGHGNQEQEATKLLQPAAEEQKSEGWCTVM